jgi:hypothetical protein
MSQTKNHLASIFFANLLLPLHFFNIRKGTNYLDRDACRSSYWGAVVSRTGGVAKVDIASCDAKALLVELGEFWLRNKDADLLCLVPHLEALRQGLADREEAKSDQESSLTEFVYPLW